MTIPYHKNKNKKTDDSLCVFDFEKFSRYKEVVDMDLVDSKALYDRIRKEFMKILLAGGRFTFCEIMKIYIRFIQYEESYKLSAFACGYKGDKPTAFPKITRGKDK